MVFVVTDAALEEEEEENENCKDLKNEISQSKKEREASWMLLQRVYMMMFNIEQIRRY